MSEEKFPMLHVYSPFAFHTDAFIVANRQSLVKMRDAIDKLLQSTEPCETVGMSAFVNDGEGYIFFITKLEGDIVDQKWEKVMFPYR